MITEKLFAHIHNDLWLQGTRSLEGMVFSGTISYLKEFIDSTPRNTGFYDDGVLKRLDPLLNKLDFLKKNHLEQIELLGLLRHLKPHELIKNPTFVQYTEKLTEEINKLNSEDPNNSLFIAGGWLDLEEGGHAMVYEFKKDKNGDLLFFIHNSGAGLNYHHQVPGNKERYCPICVYRIPDQGIKEDRLNWFLGELLKPLLKIESFSAKKLYEETFPKVAYLKGALEDPFRHTSHLTPGQHSGTCAEKVLHQLTKSAFLDKKMHRQFIYYFKKYALEQNIQRIEQSKGFNDPGQFNQIRLAIENMSRLLLKEDYFDEETKKKETGFLLSIENKINQSQEENEQNKPSFSKRHQSKLHKPQDAVITLVHPEASQAINLESKASDISPIKPIFLVHFDFQAKNLKNELKLFTEHIFDLVKKDPDAALESLQLLFIKWPLPPDMQSKDLGERLKNYTSEEQNAFISSLSSLNSIYVREYKKRQGTLIKPQFLASQLSFISIIELLHQNNAKLESLLPTMGIVLEESLDNVSANPYLSSEEPLIDARLSQLITRLRQGASSLPSRKDDMFRTVHLTSYYDEILKKHDLYTQLVSFFDSYCDEKRISSQDRVFSYYMNSDLSDLRALFLMKEFIENRDNQNHFIKSFAQSTGETPEDLTRKLQAAQLDFIGQHTFEKQLSEAWIAVRSEFNKQINQEVIDFPDKGQRGRASSPLVTALSGSRIAIAPSLSLPNNSLTASILESFDKNPNSIQVADFIPEKNLNSQSIKWVRELLHLRTSALQIPATISFFRKNIHLLDESEIQLYLEKNLFAPLLLQKALDKQPEVIKDLQSFLNFSIEAFTKKDSSNTCAFFFMKLDVKFCLYSMKHYRLLLDKCPNENKEFEKIHAKLAELNEQITSKLNQINQLIELYEDKYEILYQLFQQKTLILSHLIENAPIQEKQTLLPELIAAVLQLIQYKRPSQIDNSLERQQLKESIKQIQLTYAFLVENSSVLTTHLINSIKTPTYRGLSAGSRDLLDGADKPRHVGVVEQLSTHPKDKADFLLLDAVTNSVSFLFPDFKNRLSQGHFSFNLEMPFVTILDNSVIKGTEYLTVNFNTGMVTKPGLNKGWLPDEVKNNELFKSLFKNFDPIVQANKNNTHFEFEYAGEPYRILKIDNNYVIQKQIIALNQPPSWYQAESIKKIEGLQRIFKEINTIAWIKVAESEHPQEKVILANPHTGALEYYYQGDLKQLITLDEQHLDTGYKVLQPSSSLHQIMAGFEDPQFVIVLEGPNGYRMRLPRYGLEFEAKLSFSNNNLPQWDLVQVGTSYHLDLESPHLIPGYLGAMVLKSDKNEKVVLPLQPFMVEADLQAQSQKKQTTQMFAANTSQPELIDPSSSSQDPILEDPSTRFNSKSGSSSSQDSILEDPSARFNSKSGSSNFVLNTDEVKEEKTEPSSSSLLDNSYQPPPAREHSEYYHFIPDTGDRLKQDALGANSLFDIYQGTQRTAEYNLIKDKLVPKTMTDGLYLAYTYLCNQQPQKAFDMLRYSENQFNKISGSPVELDILQWMVFSTPAKLKDSKIKAKVETPEFLAVQVKAMQLLASFKSQNPAFQVTKNKNTQATSPREVYEKQMFEKRKSFYENLHINIYALYHKYYHVQDNIPDTMLLNEEESLTLLREVYLKPDTKPVGILAAQWQKLELMNRHFEQRKLEQKARTSKGTLPKELKEDIERVTTKLAQNKSILAVYSSIADKLISMGIPNQINWKFEALPFTGIEGLNQWYKSNHQSKIDLDRLIKLPIDEEYFIGCIPKLCDAIYQDTLRDDEKEKLLLFCQETLVAHSNVCDSKSNVPLLSNLLYSFLLHKDKVKNFIEENKSSSSRKPDQYHYEFSEGISNFNQWMQNISGLLSLSTPPLTASVRAVEHTQGKLTTTREMTLAINKTSMPIQPVELNAFESEDFNVKTMMAQGDDSLSSLFQELSDLSQRYNSNLSLIKNQCEGLAVDFITHSQQIAELDNQAGILTHDFEQNKAQLFLKALGSPQQQSEILKTAERSKKLLKKISSAQLSLLEAFANQNLDLNPDNSVEHSLKLLGRKMHHLRLPELLHLYLINDFSQTMKATGLNVTQVKELHDMITEYLAYSIHQQQFTRISDACTELVDYKPLANQDDLLSEQLIVKLGNTLTAENNIPHGKSPALMLFQYDQNILIQETQKELLESLLKLDPKTEKFPNKVIQLIMGGGKSTVLLPLLALQKANGTNLCIIEVPKALYKTNCAELNQITARLFNRKGFDFEFNRESIETVDFKKLYKQFKNVSNTQSYVITTKDSMDSLDLTYNELLAKPLENRTQWAKQVKWLDRILKLVKSGGDALMDEMDSNLYIREQFNYTVGDETPVPSTHTAAVLDLYQFMNTLSLEGNNVLNLALNTESLSKESLDKLLDCLSKELIFNEHSPLFTYLPKPLEEQDGKHLTQYLINQCTTMPNAVANNSEAGKFLFKLFKGELCHLLPNTLSMKLYENYGPSQDLGKPLLKRLITVPYKNSEPKESSKDSNHLKTLNLTVQSTLQTGLSPEVSQFILGEIIDKAKKELLAYPKLGSIDNVSSGIKINEILHKISPELKLSVINFKDSRQLEKLTSGLKKDRDFIFHTLAEYILPEMRIDSQILTHNSLNHSSMYSTTQGFTGTPWNWRTMDNMDFDEAAALGTDGLTLTRLKAKKLDGTPETEVHTVAFKDALQWVQQALAKCADPANFRALIDIGATFRGIPNYQIAQVLAQYAIECNQTYQTTLKYVLYFDKDNLSYLEELYAIPVNAPASLPISLKGKTTQEINSLLQCSEEDRLTYYDQKHTVGSNIKQALAAHALVTVDQKTFKKDLCQGVMRMRGFGNGQKISIVISEETQDIFIQNKEAINIESLIKLTEKNEIKALLQDHFTCALQMMTNKITDDLKSRIYAVEDSDASKKSQLYLHFQDFFMQSISEQFIEEYGFIEQNTATSLLLDTHSDKLSNEWVRVLKEAEITLNTDDLLTMKSKLNDIRNKTLPYCDTQYMHHQNSDLVADSQSKKEMKGQMLQDQNQELETDKAYAPEGYKSDEPQYWISRSSLEKLFNLKDEDVFKNRYDRPSPLKTYPMPSLNQYATSGFNKNMRRSYNFIKTSNYDVATRIIPSLQKQVHSVLMIQKSGELKSIILTFKEAEMVQEILEKNQPQPPDYAWIMDTQDTFYACGLPPKELLASNYEPLMHQVRFYNGDFKLLEQEDLSGTWLMEDFAEKFKYFEEELLPFRIVEKQNLIGLKNKISSLNQAFQEVLNSPDRAFSLIDFTYRYPLLNSANFNSLDQFHQLCQQLIKFDDGLSIPGYARSYYYFNLIMHSTHPRISEAYFTRLDSESLKNNLIQWLEVSQIKKDVKGINTLFNQNPFNQEKREILLEAVSQSFSSSSFMDGLLGSSDEELKGFLEKLDPLRKKQLISSLSISQMIILWTKKMDVLRALGGEPLLEKDSAVLGRLYNKATYVSNYEYILKDPEKLLYFQHLASSDYLKNFWISEGESGPLCEILYYLCLSGPNTSFSQSFEEACTLFDVIPEELSHSLWSQAANRCDSQELILNPLVYLNEKLSLQSWKNFMLQDSNSFLKLFQVENPSPIINFFYQQLVKMSEEDIIDLTKKLTGKFGSLYGKTLLEVLVSVEEQIEPQTYVPLKNLLLRATLLSHIPTINSKNFSWDLNSSLKDYQAACQKIPNDLIPLTKLRMDNSDPCSPLVIEIIKAKGSESTLKTLNKLLQDEDPKIAKNDEDDSFTMR